jgi:hypothetical protein
VHPSRFPGPRPLAAPHGKVIRIQLARGHAVPARDGGERPARGLYEHMVFGSATKRLRAVTLERL